MGKKVHDRIQIATGPYDVTAENSRIMARNIKYRHYKPEELDLARAFIRKPYIVGKYFFDFYLMTENAKNVLDNEGPPVIQDIVPWMQRIDAVLMKGKEIFIIEFKIGLRSSGIGQLLVYKDLYQRQYLPKEKINMIYVVKDDDPTLHGALQTHGIQLIVVPYHEVHTNE